MQKEIENLKLESVVQKMSGPHGKIEKRRTNTFNIRLSGSMEYYFKNERILVSAGEMIFLPKGSSYQCKNVSKGPSECVIINMQGMFDQNEPIKFPVEDFRGFEILSTHFADLWNFGNVAERYQCMSLLYELLSYVSNFETLHYADKKKLWIIEPAVDYLKKHIYDASLKMENLHHLCGVSDTYFRKIFITRFGTSPKNYVMEKRVAHAKTMIDSGDFVTVKELAETVGYTDPLYFGKVFKKHYGVPPTTMNYME